MHCIEHWLYRLCVRTQIYFPILDFNYVVKPAENPKKKLSTEISCGLFILMKKNK